MRGIILKLILLATLVFFTGCEEEANQSTIKGTISETTGTAISGAEVVVYYADGNKTTHSDASGAYSFSELPSEGDVSLSVSKSGYVSVQQDVLLDGSEIVVDFTLQEDIVSPVLGELSGVIRNVAGEPLEGVHVFTQGYDTVTNAAGEYVLYIPTGETFSVSAELADYAQNSRNVVMEEDGVAQLDMVLVVVDKVMVFDVNTGATISTKGASVELGASSIVNQDGSAFTGNVVARVSFNQVTSSIGREAFPGDYIGLQTNGDETVLQSYGFIDVTLEDENGNTLRLADGATARLTYPMDSNIETTPATIPLWYYDIELGIWVEDGVAVYDAGTNTYSGTVSHFTTWNLDAKAERAVFQGCVEDASGLRIENAALVVEAQGWMKVKQNEDAQGAFKFINAPANFPITLTALSGDSSSTPLTFTLSTGETRELGCLVLDQGANTGFASVSGRVLNSDGTPMSNTHMRIKDNGEDLGYLYTDANGYFQTDIYTRPQSNKLTLSIQQSSFLYIDKTYQLDKFTVNTNLGDIELKTSLIKGCVVRPDGSSDFTGTNLVSVDALRSNTRVSIDQNGQFSFVAEQNNFARTMYIFADNYTLTRAEKFNANADVVDMTDTCFVLEPAADINETVSVDFASDFATDYLLVDFGELMTANDINPRLYDALMGGYTEVNGQQVENEKLKSGSFSLSKNGVYRVFAMREDYSAPLQGTLTITVKGKSYVLEIPKTFSSYNWLGFGIEVHQGKIKVVEINRSTYDGRPS